MIWLQSKVLRCSPYLTILRRWNPQSIWVFLRRKTRWKPTQKRVCQQIVWNIENSWMWKNIWIASYSSSVWFRWIRNHCTERTLKYYKIQVEIAVLMLFGHSLNVKTTMDMNFRRQSNVWNIVTNIAKGIKSRLKIECLDILK